MLDIFSGCYGSTHPLNEEVSYCSLIKQLWIKKQMSKFPDLAHIVAGK